ncbi:MAG: 4-hydroxy-3-methylbut-2-enyl diphosphate reductase [Candidatus Acetothermia bacterium]|jgi:4-hydroxy-3-methylbut-2-enyl diphosphate reductase|nr:4-hydroxy-3-methylbut-2-enyl diphosphate reductase [Candidatus Acetothermia bacterium]MDH7505034.1 4-hydroxy-3-methylbut-2-enyl diphosphate reductase [Candidatus Acetothermia bacterium]
MEIELVRPYGFCSGVRRTVGLVERLLRERGQLYCFGELIHNLEEVARLAALGLRTVSSLEELPIEGAGKRFLIRAHGLPPQILEEVKQRGYQIVDGTCPRVLAAHSEALRLAAEGYRLVLVGHREHPELAGLLGAVGGRAEVVLTPEELSFRPGDRLGVLSQTTLLPEQFTAVVAAAARQVRELKAVNTLCQETLRRQEAVREAACRVELMLVIGGRNSSNTARLAEIAARYTGCYHIESPNQLERRWLMGKHRIGISGGTSTPETSLRAVQGEIERLMGGVNDGKEDGRVRREQ